MEPDKGVTTWNNREEQEQLKDEQNDRSSGDPLDDE